MRRRSSIVALALLTSACGQSHVTPDRLERAFALTFANLVVSQQNLLGRQGLDSRVFGTAATCHRAEAGHEPSGSGDWRCTVTWSIPDRRGTLRDSYELVVTPSGCYTATADSGEAHVGRATLTTSNGLTVPNLLYAFDACFDTQ